MYKLVFFPNRVCGVWRFWLVSLAGGHSLCGLMVSRYRESDCHGPGHAEPGLTFVPPRHRKSRSL